MLKWVEGLTKDVPSIRDELGKMGLKMIWEIENRGFITPGYEALYETPFGTSVTLYEVPGIMFIFDADGKAEDSPLYSTGNNKEDYENALNWLREKVEQEIEINKGSYI